MIYLTVEDLLALCVRLHGTSDIVRDIGLLESAAARPQASAFGEDAYTDLWTKAAALLHSLVKNHALVDGNKRLAWFATVTFLHINGHDTTPVSEAVAVQLVVDVATDVYSDVTKLAKALENLMHS